MNQTRLQQKLNNTMRHYKQHNTTVIIIKTMFIKQHNTKQRQLASIAAAFTQVVYSTRSVFTSN